MDPIYLSLAKDLDESLRLRIRANLERDRQKERLVQEIVLRTIELSLGKEVDNG